MTAREKVYQTFEDPSFSSFAKWYSIGMMMLILLSTTCFVLESEATLESGGLSATNALEVFNIIEVVSVLIFSGEYVVRFACCPCENYGAFRFIISLSNLVDLLAVLPFWISIGMQDDGGGLGFVRVIRLVRVFRVFKFGKYSTGIQMFTGAIGKSTQALSILLFMLSLTVVILSSVMYMAEGSVADSNSSAYDPILLGMAGFDEAAHQYCFGTIPRSFWWAFVSMTTVGYGDCYPITTGGKLLAIVTMLLGVLILALPITVVGSNFQKMVELHEEESSMLREYDHSEDGMIDEAELRQFILAKRKDNALRKDVDLNPSRLMAKYDPQGTGILTFDRFQELKREIIDEYAADPHANTRTLLKRTSLNEENIKAMKEQLNRIEKLLVAVLAAPDPSENGDAIVTTDSAAEPPRSPLLRSRIGPGSGSPAEEPEANDADR